jgi:S1-C subfamily serine protease
VPLSVDGDENTDEVSGRLTDGMRVPVHIDGSRSYVTFVVDVPRRTQSMRLVMRASGADVDLYARRGALMESYSEADASASSSFPSEQLYLKGRRKLKAGRWYIDVTCPSGHEVDATLEVDFNVEEVPDFYEQIGRESLVILEPDTWQPGQIDRALARYQTHLITVPEGAMSMSVQTRAAQYDIDLFLKQGAPIGDWEQDFDHKQVSARLDESLRVDAPLAAGEWYLDVVSFRDEDAEISYEIQVRFDTDPVDDLQEIGGLIPEPPPTLSALERALWSTVRLDSEGGSGSGTVLSADGIIITNHHVVFDDDEQSVVEEIYVSLPHAFDRAPAQRFLATVLEHDDELDLALLQVTSDISGGPLPDDAQFYPIPIGASESLRLGQLIWVGGYPSVGGGGSRSPISVTSGIMSGWDTTSGEASWIKTDARINAGNSGGGMYDASGHLIGVPTMERIEADDEMGYARPVHLIPLSWLERLPTPETPEPPPAP